MSNRILWILIIIWFLGLWYLYYETQYLPRIANEKQDNLTIENDELEKNINELILKEEIKKEIVLAKEVIEKKEISKIEKVKELRITKKAYKSFKLDDNKIVHFEKNENTLDLLIWTKKIWNFELVFSHYLRVENIKGSDNDLYIEVWEDKFYYNSNTKIITWITLNIDIQYVKIWLNNNLIFVTTKWSFIYQKYKKNLDFFSYFTDFIYYDDWYIWLVKQSEKRILNNLWLKSEKENIFVYYNPNTKEKKIIYETNVDIINVFVKNDKVYVLDSFYEIFELENVK